jgi:hypothetical protein
MQGRADLARVQRPADGIDGHVRFDVQQMRRTADGADRQPRLHGFDGQISTDGSHVRIGAECCQPHRAADGASMQRPAHALGVQPTFESVRSDFAHVAQRHVAARTRDVKHAVEVLHLQPATLRDVHRRSARHPHQPVSVEVNRRRTVTLFDARRHVRLPLFDVVADDLPIAAPLKNQRTHKQSPP